jgi:hypothetical protein
MNILEIAISPVIGEAKALAFPLQQVCPHATFPNGTLKKGISEQWLAP